MVMQRHGRAGCSRFWRVVEKRQASLQIVPPIPSVEYNFVADQGLVSRRQGGIVELLDALDAITDARLHQLDRSPRPSTRSSMCVQRRAGASTMAQCRPVANAMTR